MAMSAEDAIYVCFRVADKPEPYVPSDKGKCQDCQQEVWYSKYVYENDPFIRKMVDDGNIVCVQCASKRVKEAEAKGGCAREMFKLRATRDLPRSPAVQPRGCSGWTPHQDAGRAEI